MTKSKLGLKESLAYVWENSSEFWLNWVFLIQAKYSYNPYGSVVLSLQVREISEEERLILEQYCFFSERHTNPRNIATKNATFCDLVKCRYEYISSRSPCSIGSFAKGVLLTLLLTDFSISSNIIIQCSSVYVCDKCNCFPVYLVKLTIDSKGVFTWQSDGGYFIVKLPVNFFNFLI